MTTLELKFGVVSTDEHIQEDRDVWTNRMSAARFGDDIPHIAELPDGTEHWFIRGELARFSNHKVASVAAAMTPRNAEPQRWEEVPHETYVPAERLKAMDRDHVDTHAFFPNVAGITNQNFQQGGSDEFRLACLRAYNDWLAEEWTAFSPRFISQAIVPMWDVEAACDEIRRAVGNGHKAVVWHGAPEVFGLPHFNDRQWDPVYATCADLGVPMCLHIGAVPILEAWPGYDRTTKIAMGSTRSISSHMQIVTNVLFSGVLDRFRDLNVTIVESGIGWIPYLLETADHEYENLNVRATGLESKPSEAFSRQVYASFWFERLGVEMRHHIGVDNILYETDFPHPTSTWPDSKACRESCLAGVPEDEQVKMLRENAIRLFHLDVDRSGIEA